MRPDRFDCPLPVISAGSSVRGGLFVTTAAMAMWRRPFASIGCMAIQAQEEKSSGVNERSITFHSP